jgi:hypothetical protein
MKSIANSIFLVFLGYLLITACDSKPKVIEGVPITEAEPSTGFNSQTDLTAAQNGSLDEHHVMVEEVLNTERYSYLNVTEGGEKFWIAIPKKEIEVGKTYYYKGGLLKRNFESKEYNRIFETLYLVSDVIPHPLNANHADVSESIKSEISTHGPISVPSVTGAVKLSELFADPAKYSGKVVLVTGKCVKVNPMIMDRNWIHIQDGSGDDLDLTITTNENVSIDAVVSFEGVIALNKDFGAGYKYDVIMEQAVLK